MSEKKHKDRVISSFTTGAITIVSITLVLLLLGITTLIGFTTNSLSSYLRENIGISIELSNKLSEKEISQLLSEFESNPHVRMVSYISKEQVKQKLIEDLGSDPEEVLGYDKSKSYFDVFLKSEYVNQEGVTAFSESIANKISNKNIISNIAYSQDAVDSINDNLSLIGTILIALTVILVIISFTLISNIIQLNIYSQRFIINTMQLVGATNTFIRRPFVWRMLSLGIIAAVIACVIITGVLYYMSTLQNMDILSPFLDSMFANKQLFITYGIIFLFGILIPTTASYWAVNRYLRMSTNDIYKV